MAKKEKTIMDMADSLARKMVKDKNFMAAWGEHCDKEDFNYLLKQVWGQRKIIAAYYFGVFIISDFVDGKWIIVLLSPDFKTEKIGQYGKRVEWRHNDLIGTVEDYGWLVYDDWKEMDKEGHTCRNLNFDSKYFEEPENSEAMLEDLRG